MWKVQSLSPHLLFVVSTGQSLDRKQMVHLKGMVEDNLIKGQIRKVKEG